MPILTHGLDVRGRALLEVYVSLTASDAQIRAGWGLPVPPAVAVTALVDTGAGRTMIDAGIIESLGLDPVGEMDVFTASTGGQPVRSLEYLVDLTPMDGSGPQPLASSLRVIAGHDLGWVGAEILLGRDVLSCCLLVYDGHRRQFTLAI